MDVLERVFADSAQLAQALATSIAANLSSAIAARGMATLVVSGGTTPRHFFEALSQKPLAWESVIVTLADERWVPAQNPRSNEGMVRALLLKGAAARARFVPLYAPAKDPEGALVEIAANVAALPRPFDCVVLGMGDDGHCASLFPGGDHLDEALRVDGSAQVLPMHAPAADEPRITLTLAALRQARAMYLHIEGVAKKTVLVKAQHGEAPFEHAPIARVLAASDVAPEIYYCP
jgi:6-phosphogluconolactonase